MTLTKPPERAAVVNKMALVIARYRMETPDFVTDMEVLVLEKDTALALKLVRMAEPLFPLPEQTIDMKDWRP